MNDQIHRLLLVISSDLQHLSDRYYIIGSCAMILSGLPIEKTSDLDLLVSANDAEMLSKLWYDRKRKNFQPSGSDRFRSHFSRYDFGEIDIEVMGDLQVCKNGQWIPLRVEEYKTIPIGACSFKVPTLKEQHRIFHFFGREKDLLKAKMIEDHFAISPSTPKK
jgi:hypothetical protein